MAPRKTPEQSEFEAALANVLREHLSNSKTFKFYKPKGQETVEWEQQWSGIEEKVATKINQQGEGYKKKSAAQVFATTGTVCHLKHSVLSRCAKVD